MTFKYKISIAAVSLLGAFAAGRWAVPEKVRIETKVVEVERKQTDTDRDKHKATTVIETVRPDGTKTTVTQTTEDTKTDRKTVTVDDKTSDTTKEVTRSTSKVTISGLMGVRLDEIGKSTTTPLVYGLSVSKSVFGPITIQAWGLSDLSVGVGLGFTF